MSLRKYYRLDLSSEFLEELKETLADMVKPVKLEAFVGPNCETCEDTLTLLKAIMNASPEIKGKKLIELVIYDKSVNEEIFNKKEVSRIPTVGVLDAKIIRYTGIPAEEEIRGLIETIMRISEGESGLEEETGKILARLPNRVYIETIVTPQCPYCPYAVLLANMMAYEAWKRGNPVVISDTIEAYENPDIADKYNVMSVPAIAMNGRLVFVGVPYEEDFINYIEEAAKGRVDELKLKEFGDKTAL
jgi:glutaredoxin-like protein